MTLFALRVKRARREQERRFKKIVVNGLVVVALVGSAAIFTGTCNGDQQLIEDSYTVKQGDTLRSIAWTFLEKNTGGRRYILEFEQGIVELNPWIKENGYTIHPGDRIRVNYWIKKEDKHEKSD